MFKNDSMPVAASPETTNTNKCATAIKTVLRKRRGKSLSSLRKDKDSDSQNSLKNESGSNAIQIKSPLKRVYNVEKAEVLSPNFMKKAKADKPKSFDKKHHSQSEKAQNREQIKKSPKKKEPNNLQIKNQGKPSNLRQRIQEKLEEKQRMEEQQKIEEKAEKQRNEEKQRREEKQRIEEKQRKKSEEDPFDESECSQENTKSFSYKRKNLENRLTTKVWQILSRDVFLLDHDKFNSKIQATNSETKKYIISVIKKYNNKEVKRLNPPKLIQTSKESLSSYRAGKRALKCAVRRRVWKLAKASIKHSKHWSQFLAENNIILENINIDKFDLSLIDLDALGIENKILKSTITWLFK